MYQTLCTWRPYLCVPAARVGTPTPKDPWSFQKVHKVIKWCTHVFQSMIGFVLAHKIHHMLAPLQYTTRFPTRFPPASSWMGNSIKWSHNGNPHPTRITPSKGTQAYQIGAYTWHLSCKIFIAYRIYSVSTRWDPVMHEQRPCFITRDCEAMSTGSLGIYHCIIYSESPRTKSNTHCKKSKVIIPVAVDLIR